MKISKKRKQLVANAIAQAVIGAKDAISNNCKPLSAKEEIIVAVAVITAIGELIVWRQQLPTSK